MMVRQRQTNMKFIYKIRLIFFFLVLFTYQSYSQKTGKVEVITSDVRINSLLEKHIAFNENRESISGFRIQIYFDSGNNSKSRALSVMNEFKAKYPDMGVYLVFQEPNYKIRVGNFRSRMDAQRFLVKITEQFSDAFIVKDNEIDFPNVNDEY